MKKCIRCGENKELSEFYKHKGMTDGFLNKCKSCCRSESKSREDNLRKNLDWVESEKERGREKYHRLYKGKYKQSTERKKEIIDRYKAKFPEKTLCRNKISNIKAKTKGNHLHHWSYKTENAKNVIELTPKKHYSIHRFIKYNQDEMCYMSLNGDLLDTKEKHLDYMNSLPF